MIEKQATVLADYKQFDGLHWETGVIRNALDYQGVKAPHTGKPLTEALLFGVGGGVIAGYFTFEYKGFDPWLHFLTRNTLEPTQAVVERLGLPRDVKQTDKPDKAVSNLIDALEAGKPAIVQADCFSLPYNNLTPSDNNWAPFPIVIYGYDGDTVHIADRARVPLTVTAAELAAARSRPGNIKHRLVTLGAPDLDKLPAAVEAGIRACAGYMLDEPPLKPMKGKFGLDAFSKWADLLASTKKEGWAKAYPGAKLYAVLKSAYHYINHWGGGGQGSRPMYADFLDEAAVILSKLALKSAANLYRESAKAWGALNIALLPDQIAPFKETRDLMVREHDLFIAKGGDSLTERKNIRERLTAIEAELKRDFTVTDAEATALRDDLRTRVLAVQEAERAAAFALREAIEG